METTDAVRQLAIVAATRTPPVPIDSAADFVRAPGASGKAVYANKNDRLGIDFTVERLEFAGIQTMDPRIVRIPPEKNNERHRHSHETLFVILEGSGEVLLGDQRVPVQKGGIAFVPRWHFHQTINTGLTEMVILAITDFGFASSVLGNYDRAQRLKEGGTDADMEATLEVR